MHFRRTTVLADDIPRIVDYKIFDAATKNEKELMASRRKNVESAQTPTQTHSSRYSFPFRRRKANI